MKKSIIKRGIAVALLLAALAGCGVFWAVSAASQVPEFYREAVEIDLSSQHEARDAFLAETTALANDLHRSGRWHHVFTVDQINAWLALELVNNYPHLANGEWQDPRISIERGEATIACRYDNGSISTVLSLSVDVYLHEPNVVALRVRRARAGALPVPLGEVLDGISQAARELKLRLEWHKSQGNPVALVTFPQPRDSRDPAVRLETIELRDGELLVAGAMLQPAHEQLVENETAPPDQPLVGAAPKDTIQE